MKGYVKIHCNKNEKSLDPYIHSLYILNYVIYIEGYVVMIKVENNLKTKRKRKGYSLEKVAISCGLTRSAYTHIENGFAIPKLSTAFILAEFFNTDVNELFPLLKNSAQQKFKNKICR